MNKDVRNYLAAVPDERKPVVTQLHALIISLYPQAVVDMSYRMPTYRLDDGWVALANQKNYVSLYTCGPQHIAGFKKQYPAIKTGKGCINFRAGDPLPLAALQQVIRHAMEQPE